MCIPLAAGLRWQVLSLLVRGLESLMKMGLLTLFMVTAMHWQRRAIILWVGWIGFNGGSTTTGDPGFAHIVSNTMLSAAFGGMVGTIIGRFHDGLFRPIAPSTVF